ncbi:MAG: DNA-deoxyinosine glycosylase [Methanomicrobiales archaeon]|nr:DNA-deoxyinosine glycosylase [Methanomicrobiales archaeon]
MASRGTPVSGNSDHSCGLAPVSGPAPRILILGSFPSQKSLQYSQYYGNPQNQFWKIMEVLCGIDATLPYSERISRVRDAGIALWDVVGSCTRPGSADARISAENFNDIAGFVQARPTLRLIVLNGCTAGRFYARIAAGIPVPAVVLPSTSPAYAAMSREDKVRHWSVLEASLQ